ncbi:MAG: hypothetical protein HY784_00405 [Chloroflexi bacterium]|nr:hypothetical protein [Chloroflexota bacterium]
MSLSFFRRPWFRVAAPVVGVLLIYALLHYHQPEETLVGWVVDGTAFVVLLAGGLALISQFVLPVRSLRERLAAVERMALYVIGAHGPIVFVQDGKLVADAEEIKRSGAGVVLIDGASGAVLERNGKFSRAVGPGVTFTEPGEKIVAVLDLRKQVRAQATQALTRDGITLSANVTAIFSLDPGDQSGAESREGGGGRRVGATRRVAPTRRKPAYPFDPQAAFRAVYGGVVGDREVLPWTELPAIVAAESFRDQVQRLHLDDLFAGPGSAAARAGEQYTEGANPLAALRGRLTEAVRAAPVLAERGIRVASVSFSPPELPEEVKKQRFATWQARWQKEISTTLSRGDVEVEQIKERARAEALAEMYQKVNEGIRELFANDSEDTRREIAQRMIEQLNRVASDPVVGLLMPDDLVNKLRSMRVWTGLPPETEQALPRLREPAPQGALEAST